ncbi:hypothetical protein ACQP00_24805 [Dactylosporangium sp. CS-047395]|uniref:hypothetical protein n=1 Tax=Dactylosporangium sp. CS-047395 TaxID=3239936 RepID=UPI003D8EF3DE
MGQVVFMSPEDITAAYLSPFGPERGYIYDVTMMAHWLELQMKPGTVLVPFAAEEAVDESFAPPEVPALNRAQWAVLATSATVDALLTRQQLVAQLEPDAAKAVTATNAAELQAFTDGMLGATDGRLGSPVGDGVTPYPGRTIVVVINGHVVVIPIPPHWEEDGGVLDKQELVSVAVRLRAAALSPAAGELREAFTAGADRVFAEVAARG